MFLINRERGVKIVLIFELSTINGSTQKWFSQFLISNFGCAGCLVPERNIIVVFNLKLFIYRDQFQVFIYLFICVSL